jgi:autotransporter passenger strand-loop-strand repeat protein
VLSGGDLFVVSGGTASRATINSGFMDVMSGGTVGASTVTFSGGGILQLDDSQHFGGLVAGFAQPDLLDLRDIAFISGTTSVSFVEAASNLSGTLTVGNGTPGTTANITLIGQYMAGQFQIQTDGAGGTTVLGPPVSGAAMALVDTHH